MVIDMTSILVYVTYCLHDAMSQKIVCLYFKNLVVSKHIILFKLMLYIFVMGNKVCFVM